MEKMKKLSFPRFSPSTGPELCSGILGLLSFDPVLQKLNWRYEAERRMTTTAVINHFQIFKQVGHRVLMRAVAWTRSFFRLLKSFQSGH
jgi:hypothetical protein